MPDIKYYLHRIGNINFDHLKEAVNAVHERTGKNKAAIFLDMMGCTAKYGAGYYDYLIFGFANLTAAQRATYVTRGVSKKLNEYLNDPKYTDIFDDKAQFNKRFAKYIRRKWLVLPESTKEQVRDFVQGKDEVFVKILDGECSHGCERIHMKDWPDFDALYDHIQKGKFGLLEDIVDQHPDVEALHPGSVNCQRVITLLDDAGEPHCLYVVQKMGLGDSFVDCNCLYSPVDIETGKIKFPGHSGNTPLGIVYDEQPDTHIKLVGYQLPFVKEAVAMCLEAAKVVPQVRYVGWDVAISKDGPEFIEGNTYCAHDFWQLPPHTPEKTGKLPEFQKYAKGFKR